MKSVFRSNFWLIFVLSCFFLGNVKKTLAADDDNFYNAIVVGFSADMVLYNERYSGREVKNVILTSQGVRLKANGLFGWDGIGMFISDFNGDQSWVVDVDKKIYAKLPADEGGDADEDKESGFTESGVMATKPCLGADLVKKLSVKNVGAGFGGAGIEHYQCTIGAMVTHQIYSLEYGVVIKETMPSGDVLQLQNMRKIDAAKEYFQPPKGYSAVELREFYTGLAQY